VTVAESLHPAPPSRRRARRLGRPRRRAAIGAATVTGGLATWQLAAMLELTDPDLLPAPTRVLAAGWALIVSGELGRHGLVSLAEFVLGFVPAVGAGVALGVAMGRVRRLRHLLDPLVMVFATTPRVALLPLLVVWLGIGMASKVAVVFLAALFPVTISTMAGVDQLERVWIRAVRSLGASGLQVWTMVVLPGALPGVAAGVRLGLGRALIAVIVSEMYVALAGVGQLLQVYGNAGRTAEVLAVTALVAGAGLAGTAALFRMERGVAPWRGDLAP
jgi:NitT/TauT family transport system permease protein